ncbi:VCBS repeat-containing protein [Svornostia abyssi]|uniref:VCBS repeat-containing protein n=1 Tax=Svornostia abyssi TaxID=2898438 RepID=A0ABY5PLA4_9ACTN|nr:VCBS repeat-containing protein [Parviterribacteraceae bacterium J379]
MSPPRLGTLAAAAVALTFAPAAHAAPAPLIASPHTTITGAGFPDGKPIGDVNGDGREDVCVFAYGAPSPVIVFGSATPGTVDIRSLGSRGYTVTGRPDGSRDVCRPLGDVNGDGRADIVAWSTEREVRVVFGQQSTAPVDGANPGPNGLILRSTTAGTDAFIARTARVGDVNGDGRDDIGVVGNLSGTPQLAGVVFGRTTGGTVNLADPNLPALLIGDSRGRTATETPYDLVTPGDTNGDGRDDLLVRVNYSELRLVPGRSTPGMIDLANAANRTVLPGQLHEPAVWDDDWLDPAGDLNGDGLLDLLQAGLNSAPTAAVILSATAPPLLDLTNAARRLSLTASLAYSVRTSRAGEVAGDGRDDIIATAGFSQTNSSLHFGGPSPVAVPYAVAGGTTGTVDLRLAGRRVGGIGHQRTVAGGVRFTGGTGRGQLLTSGPSDLVVHTIGAAPADTTAPSLTNVKFETPVILRGCSQPCGLLSTSRLLYAIDETAYMEVDVRRGTTVVATSRGLVPARRPGAWPGGDGYDYRLAAILVEGFCVPVAGCSGDPSKIVARLPAGAYTATMRATDLAGNRSATRTATVLIQ